MIANENVEKDASAGEPKIEVVLLDVMDTLVQDPFFSHMPQFHGQSLASLAQGMDSQAWFAFERGELTQEEYRKRYFLDRRDVDLDGVIDCMKNGYVFLQGIEALLQELSQADVKVYALSNYPIWWEWIEERLELSRFLQWRFMSCRLGMRKPDPALFQAVLEELNIKAEHCLFVDDRRANCEGARLHGINAIEFHDSSALKENLQAYKVL